MGFVHERRRGLWFLVVLGLILVIAWPVRPTLAQPKDTLVIALPIEVPSADTHLAIGLPAIGMAAQITDTLVVLDSYAGYYGTTLYAPAVASIPKVPRVSIDLVGSATNLKQSIETKQVDVAFRTLTPTDLTDLQNRASTLGLKVDIGASPQIRYLVFNVNLVPDVRVRRAIAYLVDRPLIDSQVFQGLVEPLYSMVPPNMPFAKAVFQTAYGNGNVAAADNILAGLGYAIQFRQHEIAREIG